MHRAASTFILGLLLLLFLPAQVQSEALNPGLGERIEFVKTGGPASVDLQVTVFQPEGPGPFPVAIINHGKDIGNPRMQARNRPIAAARQFLARGYAVVAPMLHGFAGSGGTLVQYGCDTRANGEAPTQDIAAVVRWLQTQAWADTGNMLMTGQSYGGLATIAYSQDPDPGVKLFINFAGGVRYADNCDWELNLREAFKSYGQKSQTPSLWFYGENDSYFPPRVIKPAFQAFEAAGGKGQMVAYGPFGMDAHAMFANVDGVDVWLEKALQTMKQHGLPVEVILPRYGRVEVGPAPTGYADVADLNALRQVDAGAEKAYSAFLEKRLPRAFVIALKSGKQTYAWGGDNPVDLALETCRRANGETCLVYAVDDAVTWKNMRPDCCDAFGGAGSPMDEVMVGAEIAARLTP